MVDIKNNFNQFEIKRIEETFELEIIRIEFKKKCLEIYNRFMEEQY